MSPSPVQLYTAVGRSIGMRRLATARIHQQVTAAFPHREVRTEYQPLTRTVLVQVQASRWLWLWAGARHWWIRRRARKVIRLALGELKVEIRTEVKWPRATI